MMHDTASLLFLWHFPNWLCRKMRWLIILISDRAIPHRLWVVPVKKNPLGGGGGCNKVGIRGWYH